MKQLGNKVVYELYPSSFYDSNGDGIGDLPGIIAKLDYLALLGIDLIWITPIFASPKKDNGYDISDYYAIDPSFGTMADVENLIKEAQKRQIGIMFDMVFNHISTQSAWFQAALKGDKKYQDYFYIVQAQPNEALPNNWLSKFGGPAWTYQPEFKGYYLHLFDKTQADLNWNNLAVRQELIAVVNFWLNKGIQGFRFDVINLIGKPEKLVSTPDFGKSLYTDHPKVHQYLKALNAASFEQNQQIITVGEMSSTTIANAIKYTDPAEKELDMVFNFHHLKVDYLNGQKWFNQPWDWKSFKALIEEWQTKLDSTGWNAVFFNNHDQPRINSRYGDVKNHWFASSTVFATLTFALKGTAFIYQGEEIGMTNPDYEKIEDYRDVESLNAYQMLKEAGLNGEVIMNALKVKSRDNARSPFQWNAGLHAGFSTKQPWINLAPNYGQINAANQINDPSSVFGYYQKLIRLKQTNPILIHGSIKFIETKNEVLAFQRKWKQKTISVWLNLSNKTISHTITTAKQKLLINNYPDFDRMHLLPYQALMFTDED